MKKIVLVVTALLMPIFALAEGPVIKYRYSTVFDRWCTATNGTEVPDSKRQQLLGKVDNIQAEWDREIIALRFNHGLTYREIGDRMGITANHVGVLLCRALETLESVVVERYPELLDQL